MAEIVNLRRRRKANLRTAKAADAEVNRARYGRTAAERDASGASVERLTATLDRHKRERSGLPVDDGSDG